MAQLGRSCAQLRPNCAPTALQLCRNCTTAVLQVRPSAGAAALTTPSSRGFVLIPIPHPKYEQAKRVYAYVRTYTLVQNRYSHKHIITYSNVHILIYVSVFCFVAIFMQFNIIHIFRCTCFKKLELLPLAVFPSCISMRSIGFQKVVFVPSSGFSNVGLECRFRPVVSGGSAFQYLLSSISCQNDFRILF